ncbi:MAG: hypothetical protein U1E85_08630 [Rhodocyclaceae bacterium]
MDGYAVRAADIAAVGTSLPVSQRIPAGTVGVPAGHGGPDLYRRADSRRRRCGSDAGALRARR